MHTRLNAAGSAAVIGLICGLVFAAAGFARAADGAPASRTPLADTGLWTPPVLNSDEFLEIPADEGLAPFYGIYRPRVRSELMFEWVGLTKDEVHYYGGAHGYKAGLKKRPVPDHRIQYRILHQAKNYVLVKLRDFPHKNFVTVSGAPFFDHDYVKFVGYGFFLFEKDQYSEDNFNFKILWCDSSVYSLFEPDNYYQPPERDAEEFDAARETKEMREKFPKGRLWCNGGPKGYVPERLWND